MQETGGHNHPTQTLTDLLTISREKNRLDNLTIGLCGDLKFGRTVHSLITEMSQRKNVKFVLISPDELKIPEYIKDEVLEKNKLKNAREDLCIMHPLPRVNEISTEVDDDPRAAYFRQVRNGKYIRMALILKLLGIK